MAKIAKQKKPKTKSDEVKTVTRLRDAAVRVVHQKGKWQKYNTKRIPVVGVKDHLGLSIIYKTPFQKNWPCRPLKPRNGYFIEIIARGRGLVMEAYWDRNAPLMIETYVPGAWEATLCPAPSPLEVQPVPEPDLIKHKPAA